MSKVNAGLADNLLTAAGQCACPACGFPSPMAAKYCIECGANLESPGRRALSEKSFRSFLPYQDGMIEGERRILSVLIADIEGSTSIVEALDPETVRLFLDQVLFIMVEATHRFGGMVSQNLGDGILALFGAPVALEDHAERACRAALEMQDQLARFNQSRHHTQSVHIRIGIDSGEVLTRTIQSDWTLHHTALGVPTHVASRLEKIASPGSTLISARTSELLVDLKTEFASTEVIKGLSHPLRTFRLAGGNLHDRRHQHVKTNDEAVLIGRKRELDKIRQFVARKDPKAQRAISIVGEPGIGKSRLVREFLRHLDNQEQRCLFIRADSIARTSTGRVMRLLLEQVIGIGATDPTALKQQLRAAVTSLASESLAFEPSILAWFDIIEHEYWSDLSPEARRVRMTNAAIEFLRRFAARPIVIVIEDIHNADDLSLDVLAALIGDDSPTGLSFLFTQRDQPYLSQLDGEHVEGLRLRPLTNVDTFALATSILGEHSSHEPLRYQLATRCNGNPLFLLETIRELIGRGFFNKEHLGYQLGQEIDTLPLPSNIQTVIASRIDRLSRAARATLRAASVLGKSFRRDHLARMMDAPSIDEPLKELIEFGFLIHHDRRNDWDLEFDHEVIRDVVYESLLKTKRASLHRQAADLFEGELAILENNTLSVLAYHQLRAENWPRAFECWNLIAEQAISRSAQSNARLAVNAAIEALNNLAPSEETDRKRISLKLLEINTVFMQGAAEEIAELIEEGLEIAQLANDQEARCKFLSRRASQHWLRGEMDQAKQAAHEAFMLARHLGSVDLQVNTLYRMGVIDNAAGRFAEAADHLDEGIRLVPSERMFDRFGTMSIASSAMRAALARACADLARFDDGERWAEEATAIADKQNHAWSIVYASQEIALLDIRSGHPEKAVERLQRAKHSAERIKPVFLVTFLEAHLGYATALSGAVAEGKAILGLAIEQMREQGINAQLAQQIAFLAEACLLDGAVDEARAHAETAHALALKRGEIADGLWIGLLLARLSTCRDKSASIQRIHRIEAEAQTLGLFALAHECRRVLSDL